MTKNQNSAATASTSAKPSPLKALGLLLATIPLIGGYLVLCGVLGNTEFYAGFLFLLNWAAFEHMKIDKLPNAILGAALGLALGYALKFLVTGPLGATGGYIFGAMVLPIVYCQIIGWLPMLVNFTTMTFLAVTTIPHVQAHGDFRNAAIALALGIVYFGLVLGIPAWLSARREAVVTAA